MNRRRLYLPIVLMLLAIIAVAGFQVYWLVKTFREEKQELTFRTNVIFREAVQSVRAEKFKLDTTFRAANIQVRQPRGGAHAIGVMDAMRRRLHDSMGRDKRFRVMVTRSSKALGGEAGMHPDSIDEIQVFKDGPGPGIVKVLSRFDSIQDSIKIQELSIRYAQMLQQEKINLPFTITRQKSMVNESELMPPMLEKEDEVTVGFSNPITYRYQMENKNSFVMRKLVSQMLVSLLLVGLTAFSFILLLRSLVQQRKLTQIKNDFISNITHELKTPIATVSVAIEALRNFDALHDPERTKEYLTISSNELQRLSFLVDKVLKLSMFEKHQVELKPETIDLAVLTNEVVNSMKLQFEKYRAQVDVQLQGEAFNIQADRLHITSVLFNLLDNALKYSKEHPTIHIGLKEDAGNVLLFVADNGIGIPAEYHRKIFDKFFRVPAGDTHNVKGYGLGLSYVAYVVQQHKGTIEVASQPGIGSRFIIKLPAAS